MTQRASIAALLEDLDQRSPAGFAIALHVRFTRPTYLFQTYPRRWMDHYSEAGLVMHDPTVHWGFHNVGRIRWSDLEEIDTAGVLEQAKDFGIMNGVTVSVLISRSRTIASFARADREFDDVEISALQNGLERLHRETLHLEALSPDDREALIAMSVKLTH